MQRFFFVISLTSLISACAVVPDAQTQVYSVVDRQYLQQKDNWALEGRLALVNEKESVSMSVIWRHTPVQDDIELSGPLAQGQMQIHIRENEVAVDEGDKVQVYQGSPNDIVAEVLRVDIPVSALRFWVLGVNDPAFSYALLSEGFVQNEWVVKFGPMQWVGTDQLPKKMTAQKADVRIKLIVDEWELL